MNLHLFSLAQILLAVVVAALVCSCSVSTIDPPRQVTLSHEVLTGTVEKFPLPAGQDVWGITTGADGALYFTAPTFTVNYVGRITTTGNISEVALSHSDASANGITEGPDGNVWFAEGGASYIGRMTPSLSITEFKTTPGPFFITSGPDKSLWYTQENVPATVSRITTSGVITSYIAPTQLFYHPFLFGISAGPDHDIWFLDENNNWVAKLCPATGAFVEYPIPTAHSGPYDIAAGPDGNLWFTEAIANKIGRITINGSITEFSLPSGTAGLGGIAAGPDGNLWFTAESGIIGRITPTGAITEFYATGFIHPFIITAGPGDHRMWFTDPYAQAIGSIHT